LTESSLEEPSATIRERVTKARFIQLKRFSDQIKVSCNARMTPRLLRKHCPLDAESMDLLRTADSCRRSRESLQGALVTLMLIFDLPVFRSADPPESARLILYTGSQLTWLRDPEHMTSWPVKARPKRKRAQHLRILQSLPGIGPDRAKRLLERFGTVRGCFDASTDELRRVERAPGRKSPQRLAQ
jgi:hypothetical protein